MTFHIAFRTTLLTGCDRFNHFLQLTPLLELEKVFGSRLTGRETFPFVSKKQKMECVWQLACVVFSGTR